MKKLSKKELEDLLAIMERNSIEYSVTNNSDEIRLIPEIQQACKQIKAMVADNIIMKDTIKTLEKMLEEKAEDLAELMRSDDGNI